MRAVLAALAWLVAVVAGGIALTTGWVATHVTSEDGWVQLTESFATDPTLEKALVDQVTDELAGSRVPQIVRPAVREGVAAAARRAVEDPGWTTAWRESQRRSHALVLHADDSGRLTVDVAPMADYVLDRLTGDLPIPVSAPDRVLVPLDSDVEPSTFERVRQAPDVALAATVVTVIASLVVLLAARRRARALVALGVGGLVVAGAVLALGDVVLPTLADQSSAPTAFARSVTELLADRVSDSLRGWVLVTAAVSLAVSLVGALASLVAGRRSAA